jgi:dihydropteroate synthase
VTRFGKRTVPADRAPVMATVNRAPDSCYDHGATFGDEAALARVAAAVADGADIPVRERYPGIVISVDTWRRQVGREGADLIGDTWHGLELLRRTDELVATGWPVLMALSNKDFVGETPGAGRVDGTLAATAVAAWLAARACRAHEVRRTRHVVDMVAGIAGSRPPAEVLRALA